MERIRVNTLFYLAYCKLVCNHGHIPSFIERYYIPSQIELFTHIMGNKITIRSIPNNIFKDRLIQFGDNTILFKIRNIDELLVDILFAYFSIYYIIYLFTTIENGYYKFGKRLPNGTYSKFITRISSEKDINNTFSENILNIAKIRCGLLSGETNIDYITYFKSIESPNIFARDAVIGHNFKLVKYMVDTYNLKSHYISDLYGLYMGNIWPPQKMYTDICPELSIIYEEDDIESFKFLVENQYIIYDNNYIYYLLINTRSYDALEMFKYILSKFNIKLHDDQRTIIKHNINSKIYKYMIETYPEFNLKYEMNSFYNNSIKFHNYDIDDRALLYSIISYNLFSFDSLRLNVSNNLIINAYKLENVIIKIITWFIKFRKINGMMTFFRINNGAIYEQDFYIAKFIIERINYVLRLLNINKACGYERNLVYSLFEKTIKKIIYEKNEKFKLYLNIFDSNRLYLLCSHDDIIRLYKYAKMNGIELSIVNYIFICHNSYDILDEQYV